MNSPPLPLPPSWVVKRNHGSEVQNSTSEANYHHINGSPAKFASHYQRALHDLLEQGSNGQLHSACEVGDIAVPSGREIFDKACMHEEALPKAMTGDGNLGRAEQVLHRVGARRGTKVHVLQLPFVPNNGAISSGSQEKVPA